MLKKFKSGDKVVADIGLNKSWVTYSEGNDGEENYYRDVYGSDGRLIYLEGETCTIVGFSFIEETITLENENDDEGFTISIKQFKEDFVKMV